MKSMQASSAENAEEQQLGQDIAKQINQLRRDPLQYVRNLAANVEASNNGAVIFPDGLAVEIPSGGSVDDLFEAVEGVDSLPKVALSKSLSKACADHAEDMSSRNFCSHIGSDNSTPEARVSRYGTYETHCGQNIAFNVHSGQSAVWYMLLDPSQRTSLLNTKLTTVGAASRPHPSGGTVVVLLMVDKFVPTTAGSYERMKAATRSVRAASGAASQDLLSQWTSVCDSAKPKHLSASRDQESSANRLSKPLRRGLRAPPEPRKILPTRLDPKPHIDPAVVKAFVHRVDRDFDDLITEAEVEKITTSCNLAIGMEQVHALFDEILARRPPQLRHVRAISWDELYAAMRARKQWVTTVTMQVITDTGESWGLITVVDELLAFCEGVRAAHSDVEFSHIPANAQGGGVAAAKTVAQVQAFLDVLCDRMVSGKVPMDDPLIQSFLQQAVEDFDPLGLQPRCFAQVIIGPPQKSWAYPARPNREIWVGIFKAYGLDPLVPLDPPPREEVIVAQFEQTHVQPKKRNVSAPRKAKYSGLPRGVEGVTMRPPLPSSKVRSVQARDEYPVNTDVVAVQIGGWSSAIPPWEERRAGDEHLVNKSIVSKPVALELYEDADDEAQVVQDGDMNAQQTVHVSFDALRMFTSNCRKQERASNEQRFLAAAKKGVDPDAPKVPVRGRYAYRHYNERIIDEDNHPDWPNMEMSEPIGHATLRAAPATDATTLLGLGQHMDHSKLQQQKEDVKMSKLTAEQKAQQFNTYFKLPKKVDQQRAVLDGRADLIGEYVPYAKMKHFHEFREDVPERLGKFGRRKFDTQVRGFPKQAVVNEIEAKPMEPFWRQQEQLADCLDRQLPPGKEMHWTGYVYAERPRKHQEMATGQVVLDAMGGYGGLSTWGQTRTTDTSFQAITRPKGRQDLDRRVPLAAFM
mmetsp:Transcript_52723/g.115595  ORF Transcript_52723/g.115595 Transcript_52723/m.115595 type:complete len:917 (-) Transcript_52723:62-2812(-)